jgi:hypothetical protein
MLLLAAACDILASRRPIEPDPSCDVCCLEFCTPRETDVHDRVRETPFRDLIWPPCTAGCEEASPVASNFLIFTGDLRVVVGIYLANWN